MNLPRPTIVIFDMDGTTVRHLNPHMLGVMEWMDDTAFKIVKFWSWLFEKRAHGPILAPGDVADPERPVRKARSIIVHRAIHKLRRKPVELLVEPYPGIYSVLGLLKKHNIPLALVSNGLGKGYGLDILQKFALEEFFPVAIFREDILKSKPNPEAILLALQRMDIELKASDIVWYIGDRHKDITAAQAAGKITPCRVVPVAFGVNAAIAVIEKGLGPHHILMSHRDIHTQLSKLLGSPPIAEIDVPPAISKTHQQGR
ncbi:MAG: HAD-IA family hydrolase [Alphaproteobacteria bacterium]|nr:HAD-IA family hydrolase [Alphaproteobacteria bacterium]